MFRRLPRLFLFVFLIFLLFLSIEVLAQTVPPEGLNAEESGEWQKAIEIYKDVIRQEPGRADLWVRISDIEASLGNPQGAVEALEEASKISSDSPDILFRLSEAYSSLDQPDQALKAIRRALQLDPNNIQYLQAQAEYANWIGNHKLAAQTYEKIGSLSPTGDDAALLGFARSSAWGGRTDTAAWAYKEYLRRNPNASDIYLEYARAECWRGNYSGALEILEQYREKAGETKGYLEEKAKVLAWAERPRQSLSILSPLLAQNPNNYELSYAQTLALYHENRPIAAIESLDNTIALQPNSAETNDLKRFILTPFRSNLEFTTHFYSDSDDLDRFTNSVVATYWLNPLTSFKGGLSGTYLTAEEGSGLEEVDGGEDAWHYSGWLGASRRLASVLSVDGYAGAADADGSTHFIYGLGANYDPLDNLSVRLERTYGYYVVSPRTIDLGIRQGANRVAAVWEPGLLYTVVAEAGYNTYSDHNEQWQAAVAPRRSILRTQKFNLDIGVRGNWFGFDEELDNGYYDPEFYQSYGITGFGYIKLSDDDGISIVLDSGVQKDDEMNNFHFGWGGSVEGIFGVYRDIMLRLGASATDNSRQEGGAFRAYSLYGIITFRF